MIYPISEVFSIQTIVVEEKDNNMNDFLDRLHSVLDKFEKGSFKTPDKRLFKAVLLQRKDICKETKIVEHTRDHPKTCVVKSRVKVILKYSFKEQV